MSEQTEEHRRLLESGEYYRDAVQWYSALYHSPIAERALLFVITTLSVAITMITLLAFFSLLPLKETQSIMVPVPDSMDRIAIMRPLVSSPKEDPNRAVLFWLLEDFVEVREAYDIDELDPFYQRVCAQGNNAICQEYINLYRGAESPTRKYERHTQREIRVRQVRITGENTARVEFMAIETNDVEEVRSTWYADITFRFSEIEVDQDTGEITPMTFTVTDYESKQTG